VLKEDLSVILYMNNINIDHVLMQMRIMASQANGVDDVTDLNSGHGIDFSDILIKSINAVNESQRVSSELKERFEMGDQSVNMVDIAIASEKAKIAFTAMSEVRNKLIRAYQDVMSMPI